MKQEGLFDAPVEPLVNALGAARVDVVVTELPRVPGYCKRALNYFSGRPAVAEGEVEVATGYYGTRFVYQGGLLRYTFDASQEAVFLQHFANTLPS